MNLHSRVRATLDGQEDTFDVDAIVNVLIDTYGPDVDPDRVDRDAYDSIVRSHDLTGCTWVVIDVSDTDS